MAIENRIQLRHGSTAPKNGDLLPWELGVCGDRLFIGLNQLDSNGKTVVTEMTFEKSDKYIIKAFGGPYPNLNYSSGWAEHNKYYGSCMLMHGKGQSFLFDLGAVQLIGTRSTDENTPLLKYINEKSVKKPLTAVFISHFHGDHYSYNNMRYLWDYGYISGETLVVFPSATNGSSGNYNSQRGYLIHCLGNNTSANPPTPKDPNNIFNYKTSAEVAVINNGFSTIPSLTGKEVTINIDESHQLIDGEALNFGDVSIECYNIDTKKDGQLKYSGFGLNTTNGKPLSDSTTTTSSDGYYNNYSMINVVTVQGIRIVITGDIAELGQKEYVDVLTKPADLMVVPHHGLEAFIAPELFSRLNAKYSIEQSIYSPAWRKKVSNIFTAELARNGCCTLQTLYGDLVFEIENSQIIRVPGERDKEVKDSGNTHLCPNAYCNCAIKWGQNIYELPPGDYITYDAEVAGSIDYEVPAGFTNAGQIKTPNLCSVNGHTHAFRVSVRNTTHLVYGTYPSFRQITITPLLFDSTCTGTLRQAVAVQTKESSEKSSWSDWRYISMTAT